MKKLLAAALVLASGSAMAALKLEVRESDNATHFVFDLGYARLSNQDDDKITALSGRLSLVYGISPRLGLQADIEQAFSPTDGFSAVYSRLAVGPSFAILGSLKNRRTQILVGDTTVVNSGGKGGARLRVSLGAEQLFLNGSTKLLGLAGFGVGLYYDIPLEMGYGLCASLRWARLSNTNLVLTPVQLGLGLVF
jgi:hypothetical protein